MIPTALRNRITAALMLLTPLCAAAAIPSDDDAPIERGRYLVKIGGCNDCHTAEYAPLGGQVPEERWLTGDRLGWRGPWGTTYPNNLRRYMAALSEAEWVSTARVLKTRPPMPWFALNAMSEDDLRALYRFIRTLGPVGDPAPSFVPPDREPAGPVVSFPMSP